MKLSGWARIWVVLSVMWWSAGAVALATNFRPNTVVVGFEDEPDLLPAGSVSETRIQQLRDLKVLREKKEAATKAAAQVKADLAAADQAARREELRKSGAMNGLEALILQSPSRAPLLLPVASRRDHIAVTRDDWTSWLTALAAIIMAPFGVAAAFLLARKTVLWVWAGFRQHH